MSSPILISISPILNAEQNSNGFDPAKRKSQPRVHDPELDQDLLGGGQGRLHCPSQCTRPHATGKTNQGASGVARNFIFGGAAAGGQICIPTVKSHLKT